MQKLRIKITTEYINYRMAIKLTFYHLKYINISWMYSLKTNGTYRYQKIGVTYGQIWSLTAQWFYDSYWISGSVGLYPTFEWLHRLLPSSAPPPD